MDAWLVVQVAVLVPGLVLLGLCIRRGRQAGRLARRREHWRAAELHSQAARLAYWGAGFCLASVVVRSLALLVHWLA